ncbi:M3 family oligoendopeptidase [Senegalia massiliensis]|uniref:M3 family oligoendopeptidase n=1 Tax=Senegalia massiliensis TaxID=1720316 RepID=UPI00102F80EC|nr:M3 family oligoendopeptidase [Senegalia massiliensis]
MKKFNEYEYIRPNIKKLEREFIDYLEKFKEAETVDIQNEMMKNINNLRKNFETMENLVLIRHTINLNDEYYEKEKEFMDENSPVYTGLVSHYYKALINSKFKNELKDQWGDQIFKIAELKIKTFSEDIIEDLKKENKLVSRYTKLRGSSKINFEGEERNLSEMGPFLQSKDRNIRKKAQVAYNNFFFENEQEFDDIYDEMVKVRQKIAKKLEYNNFIELAYDRHKRSDYNKDMVKQYRDQIKEEIVPIANSLRKRQAERLGIENLKYYDEPLEFLSGNATPKGDKNWMIQNAEKMYNELSAETGEFFKFMKQKNLMDLEAKKGKAGGGYCTFIDDYKSPFIFSNFNGTSDDVDVLTHEAGHAFQMYSSRDFELPEYNFPTLDACEIHSMSMEFLAWPWMDLFFKEDTLKYKFSHLSGTVLFLPYGALVDEFQHFVFENPEVSKIDRKRKWRELEKKYLPNLNYEDNDFLERGGFWFRQGHIFTDPFYYIDYTLAQVCAFQYWVKYRDNKEEALESYIKLCKMGGSKSFLELVEFSGLKNPFNEGTISEISKPIKEWLEKIDDKKL